MTRLTSAFTALIACAAPAWHALNAQSARAEPTRIINDIGTLAHDRWQGRLTCTPGNDSAATFIANRFTTLGLEPAVTSGASPHGAPAGAKAARTYFHPFIPRPTGNVRNAVRDGCTSNNVAAIIRGTDAALANEFVVIGAHYDHLGRSTVGARDPHSTDSIRNGADDNASGTAGILELARLFRDAPTKRSLLFVAFSAEELGLLGSAKFVEEALPPGRMQAMMNLDMVGRLRNNRLLVFGVGSAAELRAIADAHNPASAPFALAYNPDGFGPSDHSSFFGKGIPVLHFFTDYHDQYHAASDETHTIDAAATARVIDYIAAVTRDIADRPLPLTLVTQAQPAPRAAATGTQPYLGSVPDMAAGDTPGLRITGVTPGSPADVGGMKTGDIVVELAGKPVTDLNTYAEALYAQKPGDTIKVVVRRGAERVTLTVTLTARTR